MPLSRSWKAIAVFGLAIFYAAYLSEIFRAALAGVRDEQREAAQALGIQRTNLYRKLRQLSVSKVGPSRKDAPVSPRRQSDRLDT